MGRGANPPAQPEAGAASRLGNATDGAEGSGCGKPCKCPSYRDHLLSIAVTASSMPSRHPEAASQKAMRAGWDRDMPAYKRLRAEGLQPPSVDGSAEIEARADHPLQVEAGVT